MAEAKLSVEPEMQLPLSEAAMELGRSYAWTLRMLLTHQLKGVRTNGRYYVDRRSLEQLKRNGVAQASAGR